MWDIKSVLSTRSLTFISRWAFIRAWVINYGKPILPWLEDSVHIFPLRTFSHHFLDGLLPFYSFPGLLPSFSPSPSLSSILTLRALHRNVYLIASFPEMIIFIVLSPERGRGGLSLGKFCISGCLWSLSPYQWCC